jgi:inosine-uridine nucleoside N-ribohydrolase
LIFCRWSFTILVFLLSCFCLDACAPHFFNRLTVTGSQTPPVIIDSDLAFDDRLAIFYLLRHPDIRIQAITLQAGSPDECIQKMQDLKTLLALTEANPIPMACGSALGPEKQAARQPAIALLTSVLQSTPQKVALLALGPLTQVAETFRRTPSVKEKIERIYLMGGAIDVPGNVGQPEAGITHPVAEWNFYRDPAAANLVFRSGLPVTLIPLDATNQVPLTPEFIGRIKALPLTAQTGYILNLLSGQHESMWNGRLYFWDLLAAAILWDESIACVETRTLRVIEAGPEQGRVIIDPAGPKVPMAFRIDRDRFEQHFMDTLAPRSFGHSD